MGKILLSLVINTVIPMPEKKPRRRKGIFNYHSLFNIYNLEKVPGVLDFVFSLSLFRGSHISSLTLWPDALAPLSSSPNFNAQY